MENRFRTGDKVRLKHCPFNYPDVKGQVGVVLDPAIMIPTTGFQYAPSDVVRVCYPSGRIYETGAVNFEAATNGRP